MKLLSSSWIITILLLYLDEHKSKAEFFSSIQEMTKVFGMEEQMLRHMKKFTEENENKLDFLRARLQELERDYEEATVEGATHFENPMNKYVHMKRLTVDWQRIQNVIATNTGEVSLNRIHRLRNKRKMPSINDLEGALEGFLRLQYIYRLKTKDLASGLIDGVQYNTQLSPHHCLDLGKMAIKDEKPQLAHSWLMEALKRLNSSEEETFSMEQDEHKVSILKELVNAKIELKDYHGVNSTYAELVSLQPWNEEIHKNYSTFIEENADKLELKVDLSEEHEPLPTDFTNLTDEVRYRYTCNGLLKQTSSDQRYLRCGYLTETHPFLLIAPIKVEELNHDPLVVLYYEVISDQEIATIKNLTSYKTVRAATIGKNSSMISNVRTSQFVFLPKTEHRVLEDIDVRVADMTNLNMAYAEDHQFSNYGIGGHYAQHMDWFMEETFGTNQVSSPEMGNRIATVLFYLSDVEQGGGTAFPKLNLLLMPKKGTAVFWYNLHTSGVGDARTLHGACPIIVGSKWVQNRWIREFIQSDRRPCELWNDAFM